MMDLFLDRYESLTMLSTSDLFHNGYLKKCVYMPEIDVAVLLLLPVAGQVITGIVFLFIWSH